MRKWIEDILLAVASMDAINTVVQASTKTSSFGLSVDTWIAIGLGIFFVCIITLIYMQRKKFDELLSKTVENNNALEKKLNELEANEKALEGKVNKLPEVQIQSWLEDKDSKGYLKQ